MREERSRASIALNRSSLSSAGVRVLTAYLPHPLPCKPMAVKPLSSLQTHTHFLPLLTLPPLSLPRLSLSLYLSLSLSLSLSPP